MPHEPHKDKHIYIERIGNFNVKITESGDRCVSIESKTVEAILLYEILKELKNINLPKPKPDNKRPYEDDEEFVPPKYPICEFCHDNFQSERLLREHECRAKGQNKELKAQTKIPLPTESQQFDDIYAGYVIFCAELMYVGPDSQRYRVINRAMAARFTKKGALQYIKDNEGEFIIEDAT